MKLNNSIKSEVINEEKMISKKRKPDDDWLGKSTPRRSFRKSVADELATGTSSELKSSKSTRGAACCLATPFGMLTGVPAETRWPVLSAEKVASEDPTFFLTYVDSSRTGIRSSRDDLYRIDKSKTS